MGSRFGSRIAHRCWKGSLWFVIEILLHHMALQQVALKGTFSTSLACVLLVVQLSDPVAAQGGPDGCNEPWKLEASVEYAKWYMDDAKAAVLQACPSLEPSQTTVKYDNVPIDLHRFACSPKNGDCDLKFEQYEALALAWRKRSTGRGQSFVRFQDYCDEERAFYNQAKQVHADAEAALGACGQA